ncbi:MFS transporter [Caballeronia sp. BR00000012568055]|uniref:MFS transporter n=1 Tax=Caballeronia sp. BR00000012568055 TaxID=2918761 RepID=UPI0023F653DE
MNQPVSASGSRRRWYQEINRAQWLTLIGAWCLWALDAVDFLLITFVLIDISKTFDVTLHTASLLILATFGVRWLGGMLFGNLSDRIGRKIPMLIALAWFTAGAAFTGLAWSFAAVFVFRLLLGFGMAPILTLGSTMIAEVWPEKYRAIGIGILDTGWGFGSVLAATLYGLIYPHFGWRPLFFAGIVPGLLVGLFIWRFVPESPVWLKARAKGLVSKQGSPAMTLFREHRSLVFRLSLVQFLLQFGSWPLQGLLATYLRELHMPAASVSLITSAGAVGQICGFFCSGFIAERIGRKKAIALMLAIGCACVLALVSLALVSVALGCVFAFLSGFWIVGASGIYPTILAENLPSNVRATGVGLMYNIGVIGGGIAPFIVLASLDYFKVALPHGMFFYTLLGDVVGVTILFLATRETRGVSIEAAGTEDDAPAKPTEGMRRDAW